MITSLKNYIHRNSNQFKISPLSKIEVIQIPGSSWRAIEYGRISFIIFVKNKPMFVAKTYRLNTKNSQILSEYKMQNLLKSAFKNNFINPLGTFEVDGYRFLFEEYIQTDSQQTELIKIKHLPINSFSILNNTMNKHLKSVDELISQLNTSLKVTSFKKEKSEILKLFTEFKASSSLKKNDLNKLEKFLNISSQKVTKTKSRIIHGDLVPKNIYSNEKYLKLIDLEFSNYSTLWYIEPARYIFSYLLLLIELGFIKTNIYESLKHLRGNVDGSFYSQAYTFLNSQYKDKTQLCRAMIVSLLYTLHVYRKTRDIIPESEYAALEKSILLWLPQSKVYSVTNSSNLIIPESNTQDRRDIQLLKKELLQQQNELNKVLKSRGFKTVSLIHRIRTKIPFIKHL